jgi:hypothetical protein
MIKEVIAHANTNVQTLNVFKEIQGLCEYLYQPKVSEEREGEIMKFPGFYRGKDSLRFVTSYDFRNGCFFHVLNGDTVIEPLESNRANKEFLRYTTPVKAFGIHRRNVIEDSEVGGIKLALNVFHQLQEKNINSLRATLNLSSISIEVESYTTTSEQFEEVFENVDVPRRSDIVIIGFPYRIVLEGYKECFENYTC